MNIIRANSIQSSRRGHITIMDQLIQRIQIAWWSPKFNWERKICRLCRVDLIHPNMIQNRRRMHITIMSWLIHQIMRLVIHIHRQLRSLITSPYNWIDVNRRARRTISMIILNNIMIQRIGNIIMWSIKQASGWGQNNVFLFYHIDATTIARLLNIHFLFILHIPHIPQFGVIYSTCIQ